jgi:uncharacterized protein (TIGR02145 family)
LIEMNVTAGSIASLQCGLTYVSGNLLSGVFVSDMEVLLPYTGGNGGFALINTTNSTGVIGLSAVADITNFNVGDGIITYTLSGTPVGSGYATFNFVVNEQVCVISLQVVDNDNHTCDAPSVHNPLLTYGFMTDQEGNEYKTIQIGDQEWMAENLKTTIYRNGDVISTDLSASAWSSTSSGAWSYYSDAPSFNCPFGKLYNWYAVNDGRGLCPVGWHVPTEEEYNFLFNYLGGSLMAFNALRSVSTAYWSGSNSLSTNSSGYSALGAGFRWSNGEYMDYQDWGLYWTSTSLNDEAFLQMLTSLPASILSDYRDKNVGSSVRCIRN